MTDLVTIEEAKAHCRIDDDSEDALLVSYIGAASAAVRDVATGWDGTGDAPDRVKLAVLARVAVMFDNRSSTEAGRGELPMLTPLRTLDL